MKRIFRICFFLFWFGFLGLGAYTCIRDKNYGMLLYLSIFWMVGIFAARRKLFGRRMSTNANAGFAFKTIISALLVLIVMLVGVMLLVLGVIRQDGALIFMGFFFILGASAFVIGALTIKGSFDKCKVDVFGLYVGIVFVIIGIGFCVFVYNKTAAGMRAILIIPTLMTAAGGVQIVKCLKNREH